MQEKKGYVIAICDDSDFYLPNVEHIERNDSLNPWKYAYDEDAAKGAEQDGIKLIYGMDGVDDGVYIDTPENRKRAMDAIKSKALAEKPSILAQLADAQKEAAAQQSANTPKNIKKRSCKYV